MASSCDWNAFPDVFAVGFEEMVDLDAKNMIKTSSENQRIWASEILKTLNATGEPIRDFLHHGGRSDALFHTALSITIFLILGEPFMPIYSEQLVGVCLYVFTKRKLAPYIRDVAVNTVKTGLGSYSMIQGVCNIS